MADSNPPRDVEASDDRTLEVGQQAVSADYKVLGYNTGSGTTFGVMGKVDSSSGFGLYTPDAAKIDGDLATSTALDVSVDGSSVGRIEGPSSGAAGPVRLGHHSNVASQEGAVVSGGGTTENFNDVNEAQGRFSTVAGGKDNTAGGTNATVSGGESNEAGTTSATVGGGDFNAAEDYAGTIGGGAGNEILSGNGGARVATIGGGEQNQIYAGDYATIAGGGPSDTNDTLGTKNEIYDDYCTIGGGGNNTAGSDDGSPQTPTNAAYATVSGGKANSATGQHSTVGGGETNEATFPHATVGGGFENKATKQSATVPGGSGNEASGFFSFAAGEYAHAADNYSFVWNDGSGASDSDGSTADQFSSSTSAGSSPTGSNTFHVKTTGGARFVTSGDNNQVTYIPGGSAGWSNTSTRTAKTNIDPVDPESVLAGVEGMEVSTWEYRDEDGDGAGEVHIGPMAEDFHDAFELGGSDRDINSINADGVALGAIQGLSERLEEKDDRITEQERRIEELEAANEAKDERIAALSDRLETLESAVGTDAASPAPADD